MDDNRRAPAEGATPRAIGDRGEKAPSRSVPGPATSRVAAPPVGICQSTTKAFSGMAPAENAGAGDGDIGCSRASDPACCSGITNPRRFSDGRPATADHDGASPKPAQCSTSDSWLNRLYRTIGAIGLQEPFR